ncbi:MAG: chemotaxis protein CheW [Opitutae bacterium]|nr:chemotaxis protein CheW [Opitutae bacterium]
MPLACVEEVMRPLPMESLAGASAAVRGLTIIRGRPTPVVDLDFLLSDEKTQTPEPTRFITLKLGSRTVALGVQAVLAVRTLADAAFEALPPLWRGAHPPAVASLGALDNKLFLVLEAARLLPDEPEGIREPGGGAA